MPTVLLFEGFRFFFFSKEHLPPHIHIEKDGISLKINLLNSIVIENQGFKPKDLKRALEIFEINKDEFLNKWNIYFKSK
jgi:hypothetical protein